MMPGTLPERELAEVERFEEAVESAIVESSKRGLSADELALLLADYAEGLGSLSHVPTSWDGRDATYSGP